MAGKSGRTISATPQGGIKEKIFSWEGALVILLIAVNIFGAILSPNYNLTNILRESPRYLAEIFMLFGMAFILVLGDIDISVGSIVCLTATIGCLVSNAGQSLPVVMLACLATGLVCGMINGFVATQFTELPTMIITLGTQIIFRGIAEVALGSGGSASMENIQGIAPLRTMVGPVPLSFFIVVICAVIFITVLNKTTFGRNVILDPADSCCIIEIDETGSKYRVLWGLVNGGRPTSELPSHLMNHEVKMIASGGTHRVIYHAHTTNVIALTFVLPLEDEVFTRELWEMATECPVVFPSGIGVVGWMVPGGRDIAVATSELMKKYDVAIWAHHGMFCSGEDFDLTFGLMHTVEKSAEILVKTLSMTSVKRQTITPDEFRALAVDFKVELPEQFLYEK